MDINLSFENKDTIILDGKGTFYKKKEMESIGAIWIKGDRLWEVPSGSREEAEAILGRTNPVGPVEEKTGCCQRCVDNCCDPESTYIFCNPLSCLLCLWCCKKADQLS